MTLPQPVPATPPTVVIVGDGPTGLAAALLLAKKGARVEVVGQGLSATRKAMLHNYPGEEIAGPDFLARTRAQAERFGARFHKAKATLFEAVGETFTVGTDAGAALTGRYLVLATGFDTAVLAALGLEAGTQGARVDRDGRTSRDRVYAGGALTRGVKSQVATSVGDGAAIAVDILSREAGKPVHDYDVLASA